MKRQIFLFVLAFIGIAGTVFGQTPATLPYHCDFEAEGDNGWTLKNGTCTNQWHIGNILTPDWWSGSLFISSDGGATAGYTTRGAYSVVVAEKLFQTDESDFISIGFDLAIGGDHQFDYLKVFWVPADTNYEAADGYYAEKDYAVNTIMSNAPDTTWRYINLLHEAQRMTATIANEPNSLKKLVFVWKNNALGGSSRGAIIDNISIAPACPPITDLAVNNITETTAEVSWNGGSSVYEIRTNGGSSTNVITTNRTITNLTPGTAYTVEVRGICPETNNDNWETLTFYTAQTPATLPYTCHFESSGDNGWLLKNGTCTNRWYVGTFSSPDGHSRSLYISGDDRSTAGYDGNTASVVVAEKLFQTGTSDSLHIGFDLTVGGDPGWDYLRVFWAPADVNYYNATTNPYVDYAAYPAYYMIWGGISEFSGRMTTTIANEQPNSLKKLVFVWKNVGVSIRQIGAIIDNIQIAPACPSITDLTVSNIKASSAKVSWNKETSVCQIRINGGVPETITDTSMTFTGLTDGTDYTVEVRTICDYSVSEWYPVSFTTSCFPVTGLTANNITATSAEVSWNGSASNYEIRINDGAIETVASTSKTFTGLNPLMNYNVEVRAVCPNNASDWDVINFTTHQTPATLPYTCNFESSGDNGWLLKNGTYTNQWHIGTPSGAESASLYISGDNGTTAGYNTDDEPSVVIAEKVFNTGEADYLSISFDLTIGGDAMLDFLKVFWAPVDVDYKATTESYYSHKDHATNVIMSDNNRHFVNLLQGTQRMTTIIPNEPNSVKKLIFLWRNDGAGGTQPGAIIDNISVKAYCLPTNLEVSNITTSSAEVSWNGTASNYEIRINDGESETLTTTSKTFTGLTPLTNYTVKVRAVCTENTSDWDSISFTTVQVPTPLSYSCDFEAEGNNGWILKNGACTNQWYIGTPSGAESASLYISGDGGTTAGYTPLIRSIEGNATSIVVAEKTFQIGASDSVSISFDLTVGGESKYDYLKVFWSPADINYYADNFRPPYFAYNNYIPNVIMNNAADTNHRYINKLEGTQRMSVTIATEPNSLKKLVFVWKNDNVDGDGIGAIIDNINVDAYCPSVTDLAVNNTTATSAEISWNGSASNYEVRLNGGGSEIVASTGKTFTNLTNETEYWVEVRAICPDNESAWDTVSFTTLCSTVTDITANNITATSADVSWNSSANGYEVRLNGGAIDTMTSTRKTFTDLTTGTEHLVEVRTICSNTETVWDTVRFTTLCSPVTDLTISNITTTSADVSWNGGSNNYEVRLNGGAAETLTSTSKTFTNLTEGTRFTVEVRSLCESNESAWESVRFIALCSPVTDLAASNITTNSAEISWNGTAAEYQIRLNGGVVETLTSTSKTFTDLDNGTEYVIEVKSICSENESVWEPVRFITLCSPSTDITANNITETSAEVSWNGSASNYEVRINGGEAESVSTTSKTFTDLTTGTEYTVEVRAVCEHNESAWDTVRFTTLCSSVTDLAVNNITETSVEISWNGSANGYEVRLNGGVVETVATTSKTFTGLTEETKYTVEVRSVCADNESAWDVVRFTTASRAGLEQVASDMEVLIYPNPAKDKAVLSLSGLTENARLIVGDIQGKMVLTDSIAKGSERYELDLKGFASGVYSVTIICGNNKATHKLIVE